MNHRDRVTILLIIMARQYSFITVCLSLLEFMCLQAICSGDPSKSVTFETQPQVWLLFAEAGHVVYMGRTEQT